MHTLEALLTLHDVTNDKYVLDDAFFIVSILHWINYTKLKKNVFPNCTMKNMFHYQKRLEDISI